MGTVRIEDKGTGVADEKNGGEQPRHSLLWSLSSALFVAMAVATGLALGLLSASGLATTSIAGTLTLVAGLLALRLSRRAHRAESLSVRDPLTGLPNRILLEDRIDRVLEQAHRDQSAFAVLVIDLDGFKAVNDVRGHEAGDAVLRAIARRLGSVVRASDTVARVGGDEFVVLSPGTGSDAEAEDLTGRLRSALRRPYRVDDATVEIDASIGWALYPRDGDGTESLLSHADESMYVSKHGDTQPDAPRRDLLDAGLVREFESVLKSRELVVHYQPVLELPGGSVVAVEALVRRMHPRHGLVAPLAFVPHVERTPVIRALTLHVVDDGLRELGYWAAQGHDLRLAVNVPYRMVGDQELVEGIAERLDRAGVAADRLTLEISSGSGGLWGEPRRTVVDSLIAAGVRLSLDDVGRAGYLAALVAEHWSEMKIDASLVREAGRDAATTSIVHALASLGHDLGLSVVAEGVEHRDALDAVIALGCDRAQGYFIQKPLASAELTGWLDGGWPAVAVAM